MGLTSCWGMGQEVSVYTVFLLYTCVSPNRIHRPMKQVGPIVPVTNEEMESWGGTVTCQTAQLGSVGTWFEPSFF